MNVLVIGSGGREHAMVWKLRQSPMCGRLYCAPGNAGISHQAEIVPVKADDIDALLNFAVEEKIDLTVVGPEVPLTQGIVDRFEARGKKIFGPSAAAARLEGSKVFAKEFMKRHKIPTAAFESFTSAQRFDAERYVNESPAPIVIKANGLAAGKGVTVCETKEEALDVIASMTERNIFGEAGSSFVIEECLVGEEASLFAITDGTEFVTLAPAQDHKRILDHDLGKNTGGMGAYAPAPAMTHEIVEQVKQTIIRPTLAGMAKEGTPFKGCLYVGLMLTATGPKVIEFNCRFGDPETQVVLPVFEGDFLELLLNAVEGTLPPAIPTGTRAAVCVVIASGGYPDSYETGKTILGLERLNLDHDIVVFHAGTKKSGESIVTDGGRVLGVTSIGPDGALDSAVANAYRAVEKIAFDGAYYRSDIGQKGIAYTRQMQLSEKK